MWTTGALSVFNDDWADTFIEDPASPSNETARQLNGQGLAGGQISPGGTEYLTYPENDFTTGTEFDELTAHTYTSNQTTSSLEPRDQNHSILTPNDWREGTDLSTYIENIDHHNVGDTQMNLVPDFSMETTLHQSHFEWPIDPPSKSQTDSAQFLDQDALLDFDVDQYIAQNPNLFQQQLPGSFGPLSPALTPPPPTLAKDTGTSAASDVTLNQQFMKKTEFENDDRRWEATLSRSHAADNSFLYGVTTTKIFCRPSCPSRRASRKNIEFFSFPGAIEAAMRADFRPCKRCKPETIGTVDAGVLGVIKVLGLIITDAASPFSPGETSTKLETLAEAGGLSAFHFHRLFKSTTKLTPGEVITACRSLALGDALGLDHKTLINQSPSEVSHHAPLDEPSPSATTRIANSTKWNPRTARKALGSVSPTDYAAGCRALKVYRIKTDTAQGPMSIAYSPHRGDVLAVLVGPDAEERLSIRFPGIETSITHASSLEKCVQELHQMGSDREGDIPEQFKTWLWRARVWVRVVRDAVLEDSED